MNKNNRNNEQIYGRNDMIMLDQNNKIYGSLGIADNYVMKTEEGTRLVLSNPKQGRFGDVLTEFNMHGRSEQFSTTGAQLFNENIEIKNRGVTIKINGSTATFKGTVSDEANARVNYQKNIKLKPGKYTASSSNEKIVADFSVEKANNEMIYNNHIEIDGTEKEVKIRVLFGLKPSAKGDVINETANIMLNDGDIALPYEPYTGGKPSPSPDYPQEIKSVGDSGSIELNVRGKNLLNPALLNSTFSADGISAKQNSDGRYTISGTPTVDGIINTWICGGWDNTVTIFTIPPGNYYSNVLLFYYDGKNRTSKRNAFTLLEPFRVTGVMYSKEYAINEKYNFLIAPQLELGSTATSYEPYYEEQTVALPYTLNAIPVLSGGNYIDQSGQQWICDEINLKRCVKVQRIKVKELSPDDKWAYRKLASGNNNFQVRILNADVAIDGKPCFCNILPFKNVTWDDSIQNLPKIYANDMEITVSFPPSSEYSSLEAFKQLLTDVKSVIYYALATPIETDLTPEEIEQYKKLSTKTPTTIVENNYNTWMKATYKSTESV